MNNLPKEFDYSKTYYKVINKELKHYNLSYADENGNPIINTFIKDIIPFNDDVKDSCVKGGIYFTDEWNIYSFGNFGYYIAEIIIPEGTKVVLDPEGDKYRSEGIIIKSLTPMYEFKFNESIDWINNLEKQNPTNYELKNIIFYSTEGYKEKAWELLLNNHKVDIYILISIMEYSTDEYKEKAWNVFKNNNPTEYLLQCIINYVSNSYRQKAKDLLFKIAEENIGYGCEL